ncbi:MAG: HD domain-containing protein [Gemmatimonadetes bacterium]|jgi:HD superfamily phosphohydrolase|nr:HD domain-containing protein [Gemmatimonadota bacterium]|tara:strand:+ start:1151 stop:2449 length:1299 start_codon:yes stop_codon:yes gene_type:complete
MSTTVPGKTIRDPLWNTIHLDATAVRIVDTPEFQRLRYIRQLGLAHLVYPGATHTRFDHALGVYHLTSVALRHLRDRGGVAPEAWEGEELVPYAGLLHDIGHYAFSHALEELEAEHVPVHHEEVSQRFFASPTLRDALAPLGLSAPDRIHEIISGESGLPLRGLVSGSLDLDKMEYLRRDARFCGVPYGEVDVSRLLQGLALLEDPETGAFEVGVHEKAIAALESLLFAKYQMFRNVYWHHGVRAATGLYKRIVEESVRAGLLDPEELIGPTDEELLHEIGRRAHEDDGEIAERIATRWLPALRHRRLPKRALELTAADLAGRQVEDWAVGDSPWKRVVEDDLAAELGLESGEVVIDFPAKPEMFQLDVLVERRGGEISRLGLAGLPGLLDLPRLAQQLYATARVLRVFTFERREVPAEQVLERITRPVGSA